MEKISIIDESGDHKYFTMIPNYILNHSTAVDQALYFQMKRVAGEKGFCRQPKSYFLRKLKISKATYYKSIDYLISHDWIKNNGTTTIQTTGGPQKINEYIVNDIWQMNMEYYAKGGQNNTHLKAKGGQNEDSKGGQNEDTIEEQGIEELKYTAQGAAVQNNIQIQIGELFDIFKKSINPTINFGHTTQRRAAQELIEKFGYEKAINTAKYAVSIQGQKFAPTITTPYLLQTKLAELLIYYKKQQKSNILSI
jgi:hypothetical protein